MKFDDDRVRAVLLGRRAVRRVSIPDLGCEVGVRLLSDSESDAARIAAVQYVEQWAKKRGMSVHAIQLLDESFIVDENKRQMIWRAFVDPDKTIDDKFFESPDVVREQLTSLEVDVLFRAYVEHQEMACPRTSLSEEAVDQLIDALGKDEAQTGLGLLTTFAPDTLRVFVRSMASRLLATRRSGSVSTSSEPSTAP